MLVVPVCLRCALLSLVLTVGCGTDRTDVDHARVPKAIPETSGTAAASAAWMEKLPAGRAAHLAERAAARDTVTLPEGFVHLREVAPEIAQEMRYLTDYNFVGAPIDGYEAAECILTEPAARALKSVASELAEQGLGLKVYDCYRPQTAVDHFVRWAQMDDRTMKRAFYPAERKGTLFQRGFIARRSGHSRGSTVDLTLVRLPAAERVRTAFPDPADGPLPVCYKPRGERLDEYDLDMGTAYDCLDPLSATFMDVIEGEVLENRRTLVEAMRRGGFRNYAAEWWHFTLNGEPHRTTYFDFPVR